MTTELLLHRAKIAILETLRHADTARYSDMMRAAALESDIFKFHVKNLVHDKMIEKLDNGSYRLTATGKEYANAINEGSGTAMRQSKISLLLIVTSSDGKYLLQKRKRQPFFGYTGILSGSAQWGESFEDTAHNELQKQTGIEAEFRVIGMRRERNYNEKETLLEDKLFVLMAAKSDLEPVEWYAGETAWYDNDQIEDATKLFINTIPVIKQAHSFITYENQDVTYTDAQY